MYNKKSNGYWTKEKCREEASKYNNRVDFRKGIGSGWAYRISLKNDWMDEICSHMKANGNLFKRCIYAYEFSDNNVYVGLTCNINKRNEIHMKMGVVSKYIKYNSNYILKQLTDYINVDEAKKLEGQYLKQYRKNDWIILNKSKTGGLGGRKYWSKEKCRKEALKYNTKKDFGKNSPSAYKSSIRYSWLNDICSHMIQTIKPKYYWTKEKCHEEALKYNTRNDFCKNSVNVYNICVRNKWLDYVCSHMNEQSKKPIGYWTKEKCHEEALKYENKKDFRKNSINHYSACIRNKWIDDVCSHMIHGKKQNGYWTKEKCHEVSLKCDKISKFKKEYPSAYGSSLKNGWLNDICKHM